MLIESMKDRAFTLSLFLIASSSLALAGGSAVIGLVGGSMNATLDGNALMPNSTIFSGDSLQVDDGVAVIAIDKSSRIVFGEQTTASFARDTDEITVLLSRGHLSMYHPGQDTPVRVKVGDVAVVPATGANTLAEVGMAGDKIIVTTREGTLHVVRNGSTVEVAEGKTVTIPAKLRRFSKRRAEEVGIGASGGVLGVELADKHLDQKDLQVACAVGNSLNTLAQELNVSPVFPKQSACEQSDRR